MPVTHGPAIRGVMEFFSREIRQPDEALLEALNSVGRQIGLFVDRKRDEAELQRYAAALEAARHLRATAEHLLRENQPQQALEALEMAARTVELSQFLAREGDGGRAGVAGWLSRWIKGAEGDFACGLAGGPGGPAKPQAGALLIAP